MAAFTVLAVYKFTPLADPALVRTRLHQRCAADGLVGTLIVADEGVNGTVAGSAAAVGRLLAWFAADPRFAGIEAKVSTGAELPFRRLQVVCKREIVTLGGGPVAPHLGTGTHVAPTAWNSLLRDPQTLVLDCRNDFEVEVGTFEGALDPRTRRFTEFREFAARRLDPERDRRIAMFCTGGIRCEKASAYLLDQGFPAVFQLAGGVLGYLAEVPESESLWRGECFVFDRRVSLRHGLRQGTYRECHGCKRPVSAADRNGNQYEEGVSCPACFASLTDSRRESLRERSRQIELAATRGGTHLVSHYGSVRHPGSSA